MIKPQRSFNPSLSLHRLLNRLPCNTFPSSYFGYLQNVSICKFYSSISGKPSAVISNHQH